jgi:hypothetical protein
VSRFIFTVALATAASAYAETAYFAAIPDLPVAPGLTESEHPLGSFASAESAELVLAAAEGEATPQSVRRFYTESLSALGWSYEPASRDDDLTFLRGRERLILHIEPQGNRTYLRARLIVRPASMNAD